MRRTPTTRALALGAAGALLFATACSSEGGREQSAQDTENVDLTIAMITHQVQGDTFWDIVRNGAEASADKSGVELEYASDPEAGEQASLVQNAVDRGVDGIAVTLPSPEAMAGALAAAEAADIPVVALNSGIEQWQDLGVQQYFGTDEHLAG